MHTCVGRGQWPTPGPQVQSGLEMGSSTRSINIVLTVPPCFQGMVRLQADLVIQLIGVLFVASILGLASVQALTDGEESALEAIAQGWPGLALQQRKWTSNYSSACDSPVWYGLTCEMFDNEAHVTELCVFRFACFRDSNASPFYTPLDDSSLPSLTYLHSTLSLLDHSKRGSWRGASTTPFLA